MTCQYFAKAKTMVGARLVLARRDLSAVQGYAKTFLTLASISAYLQARPMGAAISREFVDRLNDRNIDDRVEDPEVSPL